MLTAPRRPPASWMIETTAAHRSAPHPQRPGLSPPGDGAGMPEGENSEIGNAMERNSEQGSLGVAETHSLSGNDELRRSDRYCAGRTTRISEKTPSETVENATLAGRLVPAASTGWRCVAGKRRGTDRQRWIPEYLRVAPPGCRHSHTAP